jgi:hypothetical protein
VEQDRQVATEIKAVMQMFGIASSQIITVIEAEKAPQRMRADELLRRLQGEPAQMEIFGPDLGR